MNYNLPSSTNDAGEIIINVNDYILRIFIENGKLFIKLSVSPNPIVTNNSDKIDICYYNENVIAE